VRRRSRCGWVARASSANSSIRVRGAAASVCGGRFRCAIATACATAGRASVRPRTQQAGIGGACRVGLDRELGDDISSHVVFLREAQQPIDRDRMARRDPGDRLGARQSDIFETQKLRQGRTVKPGALGKLGARQTRALDDPFEPPPEDIDSVAFLHRGGGYQHFSPMLTAGWPLRRNTLRQLFEKPHKIRVFTNRGLRYRWQSRFGRRRRAWLKKR